MGQESQASSWVEAWNSACLSRCPRGQRLLVELYLEPGAFSERCTGVSVPFRVVTSSIAVHSKRCPGIGFLSRVDREIGVLRNVEPPKTPRLECRRETGLILRCNGKVGNPFQTKQGNRPSCRGQEGRRGSEQVLSGTPVFLSSQPGMSGNFLGCIKDVKYCLNFKSERGTSL